MTIPFSHKTAFELEQEMHEHFEGSIDQIADNYNRTKEQYQHELSEKRKEVLGY